MRRSAEDGSSGRIRPSDRHHSAIWRGLIWCRAISRSPLRWAAAVVFSGLCWWLLLSGSPQPGSSGAALGLLTLGGWGLGVLPVHSDHHRRGPEHRSATQPQTARGGVEPGGLQDGAQR